MKNTIFEISMIPQTLNIKNYRTTSAKSINLHIIRKLIEYFLKNGLVKAMFIPTVFEILLFEATIIFIIFWLFYVLPIFFSLQLKRSTIICNKHAIYELPHELPNDLKLRKLSKKQLKNRNQNFPVFRYFTWKLEFVSNILRMIGGRYYDPHSRSQGQKWLRCFSEKLQPYSSFPYKKYINGS